MADEKIYEAIYKNVEKIPGYSRYSKLAKEILKQKFPLKYIMGVEDCYYGIAKTLIDKIDDKSKPLICEVGCGQGYLTYALVNAGYNAIGLDISKKAIELAKIRYGDHYHATDLKAFIETHGRKPSYIISSELIEHLSDPVLFIGEMLDCLAPGGSLILTTPNKLPTDNQIWDTELPPVHLWHFSRRGLIGIARQLSSGIEFVNLSEFYKIHIKFRKKSDSIKRLQVSIMDENYKLIKLNEKENNNSNISLKSVVRNLLPLNLIAKIQKIRMAISGYYVCDDNTSLTLCAIFTRKT
ncbi:MAG: methyltransferase domain-containing protein [Glaciimonas sp.]|nr:methyltransferase domain-containing protein [Glaciimonas sp.]